MSGQDILILSCLIIIIINTILILIDKIHDSKRGIPQQKKVPPMPDIKKENYKIREINAIIEVPAEMSMKEAEEIAIHKLADEIINNSELIYFSNSIKAKFNTKTNIGTCDYYVKATLKVLEEQK